MDVESLNALKRTQLQSLAKKHGIKANQKNSDIIRKLLQKDKSQNELIKVDRQTLPSETTNDKRKSLEIIKRRDKSLGKSMVLTPITKQNRTPVVVQEKLSTKKENSKPAEKNIKGLATKPSKTCIPKLNSSAYKKKINWEAIHQNCFAKMESIGDYMEKKQKRKEQLKSDVENATQNAQNVLAQMKNTHNTPQSKTPGRNNLTQVKRIMNTPSSIKGNLPRLVTKTSTVGILKRPTLPTSNSAVKPQKMPFKFNCCQLNATTVTPGKFDLKESLKRPLSYQPHAGKLKSFQDKYICKERAAEKRRVDVKTIQKKQTRDDRRMAVNDRRNKAKSTAMDRRRGIVE
eukprot:gene19613-21544_t